MALAVIVLITLGLGVGLWLKGNRNIYYVPENLSSTFLSKLVRPPRLLFLVFGAPKASSYPLGVMSAYAVFLQLLGIGMLFYTVLYVALRQDSAGMFFDLVLITAVAFAITFLIARGSANR